MGPAFPVHETTVRAEGIVRVMGTPGRAPASPLGSQGILGAVRACVRGASLAAALDCGCPPRPSHAPSLCLCSQITELRQKLADLQKQVTDLEAEREQKQRDFDRKLLLAKSKIEMEEASMTVGLANSAPEACSPLTIARSWGWESGDPAPSLTPVLKGCVA